MVNLLRHQGDALPAGYAITELSSLEALEAVRPLWEACQQHPLADFEFYAVICRARSDRTQPCVLVLWRDQTPVALLAGRVDTEHKAIRIGYATLASLTVRQLRFIAGGALGDLSEQHLACFIHGVDRLMRAKGIAVAVFEGMTEGTAAHGHLRDAFGTWRRATVDGASRHWRMALSDTWEGFMKTRPAKHRYWLNRLPRMLQRQFPGRWHIDTFTAPETATGFVDAAERVASSAYHRSMGAGFCKNEEYTERVKLEAARGRLRGYVLTIDGHPRAFWYCVVYRDTLHLIATAYDPAYKAFELGTLLLMRVFKDHCGNGVREVDFGLGDADYKQRFGTDFVVEALVSVFAATPKGLVLRCLYGLLHTLNQAGRRAVDGLGATRRLKTLWRTRLIT